MSNKTTTMTQPSTADSEVKSVLLSETPAFDEWDFSKNKSLDPYKLKSQSNKKAWWVGKDCGHSWETVISRRTFGDGCPYCGNRKLLKGFNDFKTRYSEIAKEWSSTNPIKPDTFIIKEKEKFWWTCPKGHEYKTTPKHRVRGQGCPYCSGRQILAGFNDFASQFPELLKEWNYELNKVSPDAIGPFNFKNIWWDCDKCGNSWKTSLINRTLRGSGCGKCPEKFSKEEKSLLDFIKSFYSGEVLANHRGLLPKNRELDIYLPELNFAIEYNGLHWHDKALWFKDIMHNTYESTEAKKSRDCFSKNIALLHVWSNEWRKNREKTEDKVKRIILMKQKKVGG